MSNRGFDIVALMTGGALELSDTPDVSVESGLITDFDTEILDTVIEILAEFHKTVVFNIYPSAAYDPTTGNTVEGSASQYSKYIIPPYNAESRYVNNDTVRAGDLFSGVAAKDIEFTPVNGMKVTIDSETWTIIRVMPVRASERIVLYLFQMRR